MDKIVDELSSYTVSLRFEDLPGPVGRPNA